MMGGGATTVLGRLVRRFGAPPALYVLLALVATGFPLLEVLRTYPFVDDFPTYTRGDDWYAYRVYAESVLHDGWTMPTVSKAYNRPGGFLYVYFVAGVMSVLGRNSTMVYLLQGVLLGLAVVVAYLGFGRRLSPGWGLVYLGTTTGFLYLDAFRYYTNRLLSENLVLVLLPVALALVLRVGERPSVGVAAVAGLALGAVILTRPNLLLLGPAAAAVLIAYGGVGDRALRVAAVMLGGVLAMICFMVLRNYVVTGVPSAPVFTYTGDWVRPRIPTDAGPVAQTWAVVTHFGRRVLYMMGWLSAIEPTYRLRPHWFLMWTGVAVFGVTTCRRPVAWWEVLVLVSVLVYVGPLLAVAQIENYGFRMFVPVVPLALLLAVRGIERWRPVLPDPGVRATC